MQLLAPRAAGINAALIALMAAAGAACLAFLPKGAMVATHFALDGMPDKWQSAPLGVFFLPGLAAGIWLLLAVLPAIEPRGNLARSPGAYATIWTAVTLLMAVIQACILALALGFSAPGEGLPVACGGALLVVLGNQFGKLRPNFFVGIRTPWTLSSDAVWDRTHRLGGFTLFGAGLIMIAAGLVLRSPSQLMLVTVTAFTAAVLFPTAWSYKLWRDDRAR